MAKRSAPARRRQTKTPAKTRRTRAGEGSIRYVESSALVGALLEHDMAVVTPPAAGTQHVTSALTLAETGRAIIRARATGRLSAEQERQAVRALRTFEDRCFIVDVDRAVLARVRRPFPIEPIRTLDAVHLATLELLGEAPQLVTVVTRDDRVRVNARSLGFIVE